MSMIRPDWLSLCYTHNVIESWGAKLTLHISNLAEVVWYPSHDVSMS